MYKLYRVVLLPQSQLNQELLLHGKVVVEGFLQTFLLFLARFKRSRYLRCTVYHRSSAVCIAVL